MWSAKGKKIMLSVKPERWKPPFVKKILNASEIKRKGKLNVWPKSESPSSREEIVGQWRYQEMKPPASENIRR